MNRFVVALFLILFVFAGCNRKAIDLSAGSSNNTSATINHSVETQHAQAETIKRANQENIEHTKAINAGVATSSTSANAISQKTEDPVIRANVNEIVTSNEKIHASADAIAANSQKIGESAQAIDTEATSIQKNVKSIVALEKKITELQDQKQKLENDAIKNLYTTLSFFFGRCGYGDCFPCEPQVGIQHCCSWVAGFGCRSGCHLLSQDDRNRCDRDHHNRYRGLCWSGCVASG
jgi:cytoskeletal protein RodZ